MGDLEGPEYVGNLLSSDSPPAGEHPPAEAPIPISSYQKTFLIHDLQEIEWQFWTTLDLFDKIHFRFFSIGLKTEHNWDTNPEGPLTVVEWQGQNRKEKERLIETGENTPDPIARAAKFKLESAKRSTERIFRDQLEKDERDDFEFYVQGLRAHNYTHTIDAHRVIDEYRNADEVQKTILVNVAKELRRRKQRLGEQPNRLRESDHKAHKYVKSADLKNKVKPPPTLGDWQEANLQLRRLGFPGFWIFEKTLCQNPNIVEYHRIVHVFAQVDDAGNLVRRLVVKVQGYQNQDFAIYVTKQEYDVHMRLTKLHCPHILSCYGSSIRKRRFMPLCLGYGYMEYAPWGDLRDFLYPKKLADSVKQIPEPFIWLIFRGLAEAIYLLHTGKSIAWTEPVHSRTPNGGVPKAAGWKSILNIDIKPMNVVLGDAKPDWPAYKTAKMIDFGLCFEEKTLPKEQRHNLGTHGYIPPEQQWPLAQELKDKGRRDYAESYDIDVHSHIFNVGLIIMSLMEGREVHYENKKQTAPKHDECSNYECTYSANLEKLVAKCVELDPSSRPKLYPLLHATRVGLERWETVYGEVRGKSADELPHFSRAFFKEEERKIGDYFGPAWRGKQRRAEEDMQDDDGPPPPPPPPPAKKRRTLRGVKGNVGMDRPPGQPGRLLPGRENAPPTTGPCPLGEGEPDYDSLIDPTLLEYAPAPIAKRPSLRDRPPRQVAPLPPNAVQADLDEARSPAIPATPRSNPNTAQPQQAHGLNEIPPGLLTLIPGAVDRNQLQRPSRRSPAAPQPDQPLPGLGRYQPPPQHNANAQPQPNIPPGLPPQRPLKRRPNLDLPPPRLVGPGIRQPRRLQDMRDLQPNEDVRNRAAAVVNQYRNGGQPAPTNDQGDGRSLLPPQAAPIEPIEPTRLPGLLRAARPARSSPSVKGRKRRAEPEDVEEEEGGIEEPRLKRQRRGPR